MIAQFIGGPMHGRSEELPCNSDGLPPQEIPCTCHDAWMRDVQPGAGQPVPYRELMYIRTLSPFDHGPLVLYVAADPNDWDDTQSVPA